MKLFVNGKELEFYGDNLSDLMTDLSLTGRRLAVEVNQQIIPRGEHKQYQLKTNDQIEIVHAIGGG